MKSDRNEINKMDNEETTAADVKEKRVKRK
jgi:hypothetical protein